MKLQSLLFTGFFLLTGSTTLLQAQPTGKLDTVVADGYLAIVSPSYNNFQQLFNMDMPGFTKAMLDRNYKIDEDEAKNTYKIESFKSTYTINKSQYEVTFYLSSNVDLLNALKAEMKKLFPKAKKEDEESNDEVYQYETKEASGMHKYILTISNSNNKKIYVTLMRF